jgi:filamentous hemagglutinin family protein
MMMKTKFWLSLITLTSLVISTTAAILQSNAVANAQTYQPSNRTPVADSTLNTQVSGSNNNFNITGGLQRGQNLLHSFTDFSIPTGGATNFTNPAGNQAIITRVTGNLFSDLNGKLNTNGANFLLINPNGVVFGSGASLNVGKALMATTANGINLVDGGGRTLTFGTNTSGDAPLLSVAPNVLFNVSSLNMGAGNAQISNFGTLQTTNDSQYIGLVGGSINFNGGKIIAPGGRVDLGGLRTNGTVSVNSNGLVFNGTGLIRHDVSLANNSSVSVRANQTLNPVEPFFFANASSPGSSINISAYRIDVTNSGNRFIPTANNVNQALGGLDAGLEVNSGAKTEKIGNISLDATGDITIQKSAIFNLVRSGAEGTGGGIKIAGNNIAVTDKSEISTTVAMNATGRGGDIDIIAKGNFSFSQPNYPDVQKSVLDIDSESLADALISASTYGRGDAGKIKIAAGGSAVVSDNSAISSGIAATGAGSSGGIKIDASSFTVRNGGQILTVAAQSTTTQPANTKHNTGNIDITTTGDLTIFGSNILNGGGNIKDRLAIVNSTNFRTGDTGKITLSTPGKLSIVNRGAVISTMRGNKGNGNSGGIELNAGEFLLSNLSEISSSLGKRRETTKGNAGDIAVTATGNIIIDETLDRLIVKEFEGSKDTPSVIANSVNGQGTGGKITINTPGKVVVGNHNGIVSTVEPFGGEGDPGGISINAGELEVYNEGQILTVASTFSQGKRGNAGNIDIKTTGNITVAGNRNSDLILSPAVIAKNGKSDIAYAKIASSSFRNGNAGKITIDAGGNVSLINKGGIITECGGDCKSQVLGNKAGNITINSNRLTLDRGDISLNATDNAGNITIDTRDSILMRRNSGIVTNSQGRGNGGNITINSKFTIATPTENNDITASAIQGRGGNVNINAQGVFGIRFSPLRTPNSDIIVSSEFGQSGTANIDTPGTDPGRDSTELPNTTTDASNQISQVCSADNRQNKLTVTGRGGLPPVAIDPLTSDVVWQDTRANTKQPAVSSTSPAKLTPPAVGWVFDGHRKVTLIAASTQGQPTGTQVICPSLK